MCPSKFFSSFPDMEKEDRDRRGRDIISLPGRSSPRFSLSISQQMSRVNTKGENGVDGVEN